MMQSFCWPILAFRSRIVKTACLGWRHPAYWLRAFQSSPFLRRRQEFMLADIGEGIAEVEVLKWFVKPGDRIEQFQKLCEVQSDKATVEITSRFDGTVLSLNADVGAMAKVGTSLVTLQVADSEGDISDTTATPPSSSHTTPKAQPAASAPGAAPSAAPPAADRPDRGQDKAQATPAVRRLCLQHNLDLSTIRATGPGGRVLKADVIAVIDAAQTAAPTTGHSDKVVPITGLSRIMVKTMTAANTVPTLTLGEEIVTDELQRVRSTLKAARPSLTYLPFILKAVSLALLEFPILNSHVDDACKTLVMKADHNISVAMDTPRGLMVPCVRNVQQLSIGDISDELVRLTRLGAENLLGQDDLQGGTFAISNIGTIGGTYATPLLIRPQVVIGAVGRIQTGIARFDVTGQLVKTSIMAMSWSADHRVVDGATIARFSKRVKALLEAPHTILLLTK